MSPMNTTRSEILKSKLLSNVELEMKKEFDHRKKLRLQQVRQQSKDLAHSLREKVRLEKLRQKNLHVEQTQKQLNQWQKEKLKYLQELYKNCLEDVGQSHIKAAEQPDVEKVYRNEQKMNVERAKSRGADANRKKQILDEENREKSKAKVIRKQLVRTKEDIRSIFVSSLSSASCSKSQTDTQKPRSCQEKPVVEQNPKIKKVLQEIPSNIQFMTVKPDINHNKKPVETSSNSICTTCGYACCCHNSCADRRLRRRCFSESRLTSDPEIEYDSDSTWSLPPSTKQSCYSRQATRNIKCYDYTNNFRKNYRKPVLITRHGEGEPNVNNIQEVQSELDLIKEKNKSLNEMADRSRQRSRLALHKARITKDFENLRRELETLVREEKLLSSQTLPNMQRHKWLNQSTTNLKQSRMEKSLLNPEKIITIEKTESVVSLNTETPNVLNVSRQLHSRGPTPTQPTSLQNDLSQLLTRIDARRKALLENDDSLKNVSEKVTEYVQKEVNFSPEINSPVFPENNKLVTSLVDTQPDMSRISPDLVDVSVKSPSDMKPSVDVEVLESGHYPRKKKIKNVEEFDGITVTVKVNRDPLKSKQPKRKTDYESGSTSYNSLPETVKPSKKSVVASLVNEISRKETNQDNLRPYINRLLNMSRERVAEISGALNGLADSFESGSTEPEAKAVSISESNKHISNKKDETEHVTSIYDTLTQKYIKKLFEMSDTFKELLETNVSQMNAISPLSPRYQDLSRIPNYKEPKNNTVDPVKDFLFNLNDSVVSVESSYFNLPPHMRNKSFPIDQMNVPTDYKKYPKAEQTFQELADIIVAQNMSSLNLLNPNSGLPDAAASGNPEFVTLSDNSPGGVSMSPIEGNELHRFNNNEVPFIPNVQDIFSFIRPQFLTSSSDSNGQSETFDVFQGLNSDIMKEIRSKSTSPIEPKGYQFYVGKVEFEKTGSKTKLDFLSQHNLTENHQLVPSPEDIESEFQKMGLGWAGVTLRKTREAAELSADSSSSKNVSFSSPKLRRQTTFALKHDRSARSAFRSRFNSPKHSGTPPQQVFNISNDSIHSEIGQYTKKKKKTIKQQTITCIRTPDLQAPSNVTSRGPNSKGSSI